MLITEDAISLFYNRSSNSDADVLYLSKFLGKEFMIMNENSNYSGAEAELNKIISQAVDKSVDQAFRKYGGGSKKRRIPVKLIIFLIIVALVLCGGLYVHQRVEDNKGQVTPVDNHDLTLSNHGIFGFKVVDFSKVILGKAQQQANLEVETRKASVNITSTDAGLFGLKVFSKKQLVTVHGTGIYTVDLSKITADNISLDENTYTVTLRIPHATISEDTGVSWNPEDTEIGDIERGWLGFGDMKMNAEQQKKFETEAKDKLYTELSSTENMNTADEFAILSVTNVFQPVIESVSPAYKLKVEFQD